MGFLEAVEGGAEAGGEGGGFLGAFFGPEGIPIGGAIGAVGGGLVAGAGYLWLSNHMSNANEKSKSKPDANSTAQSCSTCKPKNPCDHLKKGNGDGDYRGGGHGDPKQDIGTSSPTGDELDSHHMPAKQSYSGSELNPADGPAIQMKPEDHQDTADYGGRGQAARDTQAQQIRDGNFDQAFEESAQNVRDIANSKGDPTRYDQAIKEARDYKNCLKEHGLLPGQGGGK